MPFNTQIDIISAIAYSIVNNFFNVFFDTSNNNSFIMILYNMTPFGNNSLPFATVVLIAAVIGIIVAHRRGWIDYIF